MRKRIGVIGAGPGGLAAGVLLQGRGFDVEIFESAESVGGRNARIELGDFKFDTGPTFFLMPQILQEIVAGVGRDLSAYLPMKRIEPMYRLDFGDGAELEVSGDPQRMGASIARLSKKDGDRFWSFRERQTQKFQAILPALQKPFTGLKDFLMTPSLLAAARFLDLGTVYDELRDHFEDERVRLAFTFQAKYLGMSPFECPSLFTILPHIEHSMGVWHPLGGCNQVSGALAEIFQELGGRIHLGAKVKRCELQNRRVTGFELENGDRKSFDYSVMNADFAYGMSDLFPNDQRTKFRDEKLNKLRYSCSTFMLYLGIKGSLDWDHHQIFFSQNYRKNIRELTETLELSPDPSFYLHNPSRTDPTLAPEGDSALYVLVPVPNLDAKLDWPALRASYRELVLDKIKARTGVDLRPRIIGEKMITPEDWSREYKVYKGATFSLAHSLDQMMHLRPHNASEEFDNLFIVGGGTHPGSGLPTILQSSLIAAQLIEKQFKRDSLVPRMTLSLRNSALKATSRMMGALPDRMFMPKVNEIGPEGSEETEAKI